MPTILIKRSNTPGAVPAAVDLSNTSGGAELAINTADKRIFAKDSSGNVVEFGTSYSGTLPVSQGGTGQTTYTNGQLLIGNSTGNTLTKATLTAGTGVSITNGAGSITIAATATGGAQDYIVQSYGIV